MTAQGENSIFKIGINLAIACFLSGAVIAGVYAVTAPVAAQESVKQKNKAMHELVPEAQDFRAVPGKADWYVAEKDGKVVAYVVPAASKGYGGTIKMVTAVAPDGRVLDYKILAHNETPGLGDRAAQPAFRQQFAGKTPDQLVVVKTPTDKNIQALTGATITSRAVTQGIRQAAEEVASFAAGHAQ